MIEIIDFTNYELSTRNLQYGGRAGEKRGIIYKNDYWILKFPKNSIGMNNVELSYLTSPLSEYIGSNIFNILGIKTHETRLGICFDGKRYKVVCACKDFIRNDQNELLIPYTSLRNDSNPNIMINKDISFNSISSFAEILFQLKHNTILSKIDYIEEWFYKMVLIDILINNNDRNEDNWGVIRYKDTNIIEIAPIYDCGNSFYGKANDDKIENIINDQLKLYSSALNGITAYDDKEENRITSKKMLDIIFKTKPNILYNVYNDAKTNLNKIKDLINSIPNSFNNVSIISDIRKKYYIETILIRLNYIKEHFIDL